jgi:hypothetical protein
MANPLRRAGFCLKAGTNEVVYIGRSSNLRHEVQNGPDNEVILAQEGYILLHDQDLRTGLRDEQRLRRADLQSGTSCHDSTAR